MKNAQDLVRQPQPVWSVSISNDPLTGLKRTFESDGLYIASWGITLRGIVYFLDEKGNKITTDRLKPYFITLVAGLTDGPYINPITGVRVYPDENGMLPDNTIFRFDALMSLINQNVNINNQVLAFIQAADLDHEFDI